MTALDTPHRPPHIHHAYTLEKHNTRSLPRPRTGVQMQAYMRVC